MLDIMYLWKTKLIVEQRKVLPKKPVHFSETVMHSSFDLPDNTKIVFVNTIRECLPVRYYANLPEVSLTVAEASIVAETSAQILKGAPPYNYDGYHLLISEVLYDNKTVYIEAKKTRFSLLLALNKKSFPPNSPIYTQDLYGTSAVVPLITAKDGTTILLESSKYGGGNFSTITGFIDVEHPNEELMYSDNTTLIERTAIKECLEEVFWDQNRRSRMQLPTSLNVCNILFRKNELGRGFVEFFAPLMLPCHSADLIQIITTNVAPDSKEHTGKFQIIKLKPDERFDHYDRFAQATPGGSDVYPNIVRVASQVFHKPRSGDITHQMYMPLSRGRAFNVELFDPGPQYLASG